MYNFSHDFPGPRSYFSVDFRPSNRKIEKSWKNQLILHERMKIKISRQATNLPTCCLKYYFVGKIHGKFKNN